jgi:quinol monooxygenase YgiN
VKKITITLIATLKVREGKMEEAIEVLKEVVPKVKEAEPGCLVYIPHTVKGRKDKNTIIFYEKYKDDEAFKIHSANVGKSLAKLLPLLEPGMDLKTCFEIL